MLTLDMHSLHMLDAIAHAHPLLSCGAPGIRISTDQPVVTKNGTEYTIAIASPGVSPADLNVEALDGPRLRVHGETNTDEHKHFIDYTINLPKDADVDAAVAESADGMTTVSVPKKVPAPPISVPVCSDVTDDEADGEAPRKLTIVAAGIAAADLTVTIEEGSVLKVRGESKRTGATLARFFRPPADADAHKARAHAVDGILTVVLPKRAPAEAKRVKIEAPTHEDEHEQGDDDEGVMV